MTGWLRVEGERVILNLYVQPGAKKTEIVGVHGDALKLKLAAPPVEGKANAALLAFLAAQVGARKTAVEIVSGETSRLKRVRICGIAPEAIRAALEG
ncbi:MAG: DUF167 family protein [Rhodocyclaceae bacterium]|nr:DUF167 family protein [Rhodocyclaceae bacterium]